jgi:hypothetical protein
LKFFDEEKHMTVDKKYEDIVLQVRENLKKNKIDTLLEEFSSLNKLIDNLNEPKDLLEEINKIKENFDFIDKV